MDIYNDISDCPFLSENITLSVGTFDGVHLGHQQLLKRITFSSTKSVVVTFANHPRSITKPNFSPKLLTNLEQRLQFLDYAGIDVVLVLNFTDTFAMQSPKDFLSSIRKRIPFSSLILGYDARFGYRQNGSPEVLSNLGEEFQFNLEYVPQFDLFDKPVSSDRIRSSIIKGDFSLASSLLGRNYSLFGTVVRGKGFGKKIGFPTANFDLSGIVLPPLGVYLIHATVNNRSLNGIANLGYAPTVIRDSAPKLEVHFFDFNEDLYGQSIEIVFDRFIRDEKKFPSVKELQNQIARDCKEAYCSK